MYLKSHPVHDGPDFNILITYHSSGMTTISARDQKNARDLYQNPEKSQRTRAELPQKSDTRGRCGSGGSIIVFEHPYQDIEDDLFCKG